MFVATQQLQPCPFGQRLRELTPRPQRLADLDRLRGVGIRSVRPPGVLVHHHTQREGLRQRARVSSRAAQCDRARQHCDGVVGVAEVVGGAHPVLDDVRRVGDGEAIKVRPQRAEMREGLAMAARRQRRERHQGVFVACSACVMHQQRRISVAVKLRQHAPVQVAPHVRRQRRLHRTALHLVAVPHTVVVDVQEPAPRALTQRARDRTHQRVEQPPLDATGVDATDSTTRRASADNVAVRASTASCTEAGTASVPAATTSDTNGLPPVNTSTSSGSSDASPTSVAIAASDSGCNHSRARFAGGSSLKI